MNPDDLFKFYREEFVPAYSDTVGFIAKKPRQVLTEVENTFSHLAQYYNPALNADRQEENLRKARDHLERVTLDCYKILWIEMNGILSEFYEDEDKRLFTINMPEHEFLKNFNLFREKAQEARRIEMTSLGSRPLKAVELYKEPVDIGKTLINSIDGHKSNKFDGYRRIISSKKTVIAFIIGILTGVIANYLYSLLR